MRALFAVPLTVLFALLPFTSAYAATEYLVVTTDALSPAFEALAQYRTTQGYATEVVTLEELSAMSVPGRDVAEQVRTHIQTIYAQGSLRFVVLGGDTNQIPTRRAAHYDLSAAEPEIITDLYFATLDGSWDADADDVFCEVDVDDADMSPEVAVGRVPARNATEAAHYVAKLIEYENPVHADHLGSTLFLGEVMFPYLWDGVSPVSYDGAEVCETLRPIIQGGSPAENMERLYQNYSAYAGSGELSVAQTIASMNSGNRGFVVNVGHGDYYALSMGGGLLQAEDVRALTNGPHYFVLLSLTPNGTRFEDDTILEEFVRNPNGGAVAAIGESAAGYVSTVETDLIAISEQLFAENAPSVGEALNAVRRARASDAESAGQWRYSQLINNLLGDPAVRVGLPTIPTSTPPASHARLRLRSITPNPFNPRVTIHFEILGDGPAHATVSIFDLAGRRVRTLWNGSLGRGPHAMSWDGRDDTGVILGSGVYLAMIESGAERVAAKMVMLK